MVVHVITYFSLSFGQTRPSAVPPPFGIAPASIVTVDHRLLPLPPPARLSRPPPSPSITPPPTPRLIPINPIVTTVVVVAIVGNYIVNLHCCRHRRT